MPNLNRVLLMGNLTRDPELRHTPSGLAIAKFGMAINRYRKNQEGQRQEETTFVDLTAFGRQAEVINQYMTKGKPMYIEGHLNLEQWTSQDGQKRSKLAVIVDEFQFLDSRGAGSGSGAPSSSRRGPDESGEPSYDGPPSEGADDIPF